MTIIVADRTSMYADSQLTDDDLIYTGHCKIRKIGNTLVGAAGVYTSMLKFFDWCEEGMNPEEAPTLEDDFVALVVTTDGNIWTYDNNFRPIQIQQDYAVVGSGSHLAAGVMEHGAHPFEAVKLTCKKHTDCSEPIYGVWRE